jgi:hypothetical protein
MKTTQQDKKTESIKVQINGIPVTLFFAPEPKRDRRQAPRRGRRRVPPLLRPERRGKEERPGGFEGPHRDAVRARPGGLLDHLHGVKR